MRKILYSPGYGAGWVTWNGGDRDFEEFMLTYQPIIDALERGEKLTDEHPAVVQFMQESKDRFDKEPYTGGLDDLRVATVRGRVRLHEYDGSEDYEEEGDYAGWL